jgi:transmembrane sensor
VTTQSHPCVVNSEAAAWDATLRSEGCTDEQRQAFEAWCGADPRQREAYNRLQAALATLRQSVERPELQSLRESASRHVDRASRRRAWLIVGMAAAGIAAISLGVLQIGGRNARQWVAALNHSPASATAEPAPSAGTYATSLDERSTVTLPDGSSVWLNSRTRLRVAFGGPIRRVELVGGQALFRVTKDPSHPFVVTAGARSVTALGTAFDVRTDTDRLQVTLVEGSVVVRGVGREAPIVLKPDEQLTAATGSQTVVRTVDVSKITAWTDGRVYFDDLPLRAAVAELNRYSATPIVIGDDAIAGYRINGMFRVGNQSGFVRALASVYDIEARPDDSGHIILLYRGNSKDRK